MPVINSTAQRPQIRQQTYKLVHARAPEVLRMYHRNITQNHRVRQRAKITMPSLVSRAQLLVDQKTFIPTVTQKVSR